jgi:hypothetical protein
MQQPTIAAAAARNNGSIPEMNEALSIHNSVVRDVGRADAPAHGG